ncbi:hypothetical protein GKE73_10000 [Paludibacterium sp. dN 18-1]|uniref:Uncharacterized protein n=1 Tax=Paludibacterium denitrificans TaxID=2675226 RepID=A0A844GCG4_9NEIS|nr:hypothetical protein [Paludibacterium denitrificans]
MGISERTLYRKLGKSLPL